MISRFGDFKLGDFGVARVQDHTTNATKMGTHGYAAPEVEHMQKYGKEADIYSLGITLYWLLNNRRMPLLRADEILNGTKVSEAMVRRYNGEPLPPPRDGSEGLKAIVLKACAYDAEDRYRSAGEMYQALEALSEEHAPGSYRSAEGFREVDSIQETVHSETTHSAGQSNSGITNQWQETAATTASAYHHTETNAWHDTNATIGQPMPRAGQSAANDSALDKTMGATAAFRNQQKAQVVPEERKEAVSGPEDKRWHPTKVGYIWPLVPLAGAMSMLLQGESAYDSGGLGILILVIAAIIGCNYAIYRIENKILRGICVTLKCFAEGFGNLFGFVWVYHFFDLSMKLYHAGVDTERINMIMIVMLWIVTIPFAFFSIRRKKR